MPTQNPQDPATFLDFATTAEQVGATTKRTEKAAILGAFFSRLSDNDLQIAARFFAGHIFALWDERTTNVGGAALFAAITGVTGFDRDTLYSRLVPLGDLGDLAQEVFTDATRSGDAKWPLELAEVDAAFGAMAATAGSKSKTAQVTGLLTRASPVEAKYLVKLLAGDLRVGLKEGSVEDALARLAGVKVAEVQWANMLTGDIGEAALLSRRGDLDRARMRLFHPIKFMLATPAADLQDVARQMPSQFYVEDKFDGIRAQAHVAPAEPYVIDPHVPVDGGVRVALFSRTLDEITRSFPDLVAPLGGLLSGGGPSSHGLVLDGEIVSIKFEAPSKGTAETVIESPADRILPFHELQKRLGRKSLPAALLKEVPVALIVFDVLYAGGRVLINEPLSLRREILESIRFDSPRVRRANSRMIAEVTLLDEEFDAARRRGNEGLMVKAPASLYKPGRRGRDWLKIKRALASLDVVVTAVEVGNGRRSHVLSDYTFAVRTSETDPTLLNVGKAYSGLTDAEIAELSDWFRSHTIKEFAHGKVRIVEPRIVIEVAFDLVQKSNRHKSGYALRFPRILRLRPDKPPEEIDTLATVRALAETRSGPGEAVPGA
jgi:DNA ligase-1